MTVHATYAVIVALPHKDDPRLFDVKRGKANEQHFERGTSEENLRDAMEYQISLTPTNGQVIIMTGAFTLGGSTISCVISIRRETPALVK